MEIRTRFAPSPTGYLHIGGVRTALFSWLHARKHGGKFILRIEDTDRERSTQESIDAILQAMAWLGLGYDEGPFFQSQRFDRYREVIHKLLDEDKAYYCYCPKERLDAVRAEQMARKEKPRYDGHCRTRGAAPPVDVTPVIRFKNPLEGKVVVDDLVHGKTVFDNRELDDLIIARSDGTPTYNLTVVVDDLDMGITHVIRGDDHLNNTPRQINIFTALGVPAPAYGHLPMILGSDGRRLSKRHYAVNVLQYRDKGYLPQALLNYLVRLGWSYGDQEIFSIEELVEKFEIRDVNRSGATFDPEKLLWLNHWYIKSLGAESLAKRLEWYLDREGITTGGSPALAEAVEILRERSKTLVEMARNSRYFYEDFKEYDEKAAAKNLRVAIVPPLRALRERLANLSPWSADAIHSAIDEVSEEFDLKFGNLAQPLRIAVTGGSVSPPIDVTVKLLGRQRSLRRIERALAYIDQRAASVSP